MILISREKDGLYAISSADFLPELSSIIVTVLILEVINQLNSRIERNKTEIVNDILEITEFLNYKFPNIMEHEHKIFLEKLSFFRNKWLGGKHNYNKVYTYFISAKVDEIRNMNNIFNSIEFHWNNLILHNKPNTTIQINNPNVQSGLDKISEELVKIEKSLSIIRK